MDYPQEWIAVKDQKVVHHSANRSELESWLEEHDPERQCVLAFTDNRPYV